MNILKKINFIDFILTSVLSVFCTTKVYAVLYPLMTYSNLKDFYVGTSIYEDHNKTLDIYIYLVYLAVFFVILPVICIIRNKLFKSKEKEEVIKEIKQQKNNKFINFFIKYQYIFAAGYIFLHPFKGTFYPKLALIILFLIIISCYDAHKKIKNNEGFSPFIITAIIFVFFFNVYNITYLSADDHHNAERFATYFMHNTFNLEYYKDIMLVHGYIDVFPSAAGHFLFNENNIYAYTFGETFCINIIFILIILCGLYIFNKDKTCILYTAFMYCILLTGKGVQSSAFLLLICSYILLLKKDIFKRTFLWLNLYTVISSIGFILFNILGTFCIIASSPALIYQYIKMYKSEDKRKVLKMLIPVFLLVVLFLHNYNEITAFLGEAKNYTAGTLYAFGNGFSENINILKWIINAFTFFFTPVLIIQLINGLKEKTLKNNEILFLVFAILLPLISLKYTMGRIDGIDMPRLYFFSTVFLAVIFPYYIYLFKGENFKSLYKKIITAIILILLIPNILIIPAKMKLSFKERDNKTVNFYNTGNVNITDSYEKSLSELKNVVYENGDDKTFLDLTNRGMHYMYFNKQIPIRHMSFFNSVTTSQAFDSLNRIKNTPPDYILIWYSDKTTNTKPGMVSNNKIFDRVYLSLRMNPVYRWILLSKQYSFKEADGNIFLVKSGNIKNYSQEELKLLDSALSNQYLNFLPEVWAKSVKTLPVEEINPDYSYTRINDYICIVFKEKQRVQDIDFVYIDINTKDNKHITKINNTESNLYTSSKSGKSLIPLDNFPSWLLNDNLKEIRIYVNKADFEINNIKFYNKKQNIRF